MGLLQDVLSKDGLIFFWAQCKNFFVSKETGKGLSTHDFTDALKTKLDGIADGANATTVDAEMSSTSTNAIQNKVVNAAITQSAADTLTSAKSYTDEKVTGIYKYRGSVATAAELPTTDQNNGDVYDIQGESTYGPAGTNVAWNEESGTWDALGGSFSISAISNEDIAAICQ